MYIKIKRVIDLIISLILIVLLLFPMIVIAICIKIESKGKCIYKSKRMGKGLKSFYMYKFRTMKTNRKELESNLPHNEMTTKLGNFLRKTSLDELPQLINIIKGEMSFIGPRPWIVEYYKYFTDEQKARAKVLPGMTGLAQVNGRNGIEILTKINYDLMYIKNLSFLQDIKIVFSTIKTVFEKNNAEITEKGIKEEIEILKKNKEISERDYINMEKPLVSVIIPVYNSEKYIEFTIKSVLNQIYENWEMILIDDCSTDNSVQIIKKFISKNIKLIRLEQNYGVSVARNIGIDNAKGKYVAFLDADDLWEEDKLVKQIKFAEINKYDFTFSGYQTITDDSKKVIKKVEVPDTIDYKQALKNTIIATSGVILNVENLGKDLIKMINLRRGQDTATWWKILKKGITAHGINEILHSYRITKNSLSSNKFIALKRTWNLYRNVEHFSITKSGFYFIHYIVNAIKRRI